MFQVGRVGIGLVPGGAPVPPPELWTPADLLVSNKLWFDPTDETTITPAVGSAISEWYDKLAGVDKFVQASAATQPITGQDTLNGNNVITSLSDYMRLSSPAGTYPTSMQVTCLLQTVGTPPTNQEAISRITFTDSDSRPLRRYNNILAAPHPTSYVTTVVSDLRLMTTPTVLSYYANTVDYGEWDNGTLLFQGAHARVYSDGTSIGLGVNYSGTSRFNGVWGDIVISEELTTDDRQRLESYIAWKYGTQASLDPSNPYKSAPPEKVA